MTPCSRVFRRFLVVGALVLALSVGVGAKSGAATFPDLFTVTVEPGVRTADRRAVAERLAMAQLLGRVTGQRDAASYPELAPLVDRASAYVISYGPLDRERVLVGFNSNDVINQLTQLNWPIWGAERPLTLLWVAVDFGDGQRALMSDTLTSTEWSPELAQFMLDLREQLDAVARERGLPVRYPLLDLEDFAAISFAEIWGGFSGLIEAASARYGADAQLIGRISVGPLGVDTRWSLLQDGQSRVVLGTDIGGGLQWLADQYAAEFSIAGGMRTARISVLDVSNLETYGRVMSYLESLSVLQSIDVEGFDGDTLNLRVAARGDDRVVERLLTLGGVLVRSGNVPGSPMPSESLVFRVAGARVQ